MYVDPDDFNDVVDDELDDGNAPAEAAPSSSSDDDDHMTLADMGLDDDGFSWDDVGGD